MEKLDEILKLLKESMFKDTSSQAGSVEKWFSGRDAVAEGEDDDENKPRARNLMKVEGTMDWMHNKFGLRAEEQYKDAAVFHGLNNKVIVGVPFKSGLFKYTLAVTSENRTIGQYQVYRCEQADYEPLPLTSEVLLLLLMAMQLGNEEAKNFVFNQGDWVDDPNFIEDPEHYIFSLTDVMRCLANANLLSPTLDSNQEVTRYVKYESLSLLYPNYYPECVLFGMSWEDMDALVSDIKTKPHARCYSKFTPYRFTVPNDAEVYTPSHYIIIPELSFSRLVNAMDEFSETCETQVWDLIACLLYDELRIQMNNNKHMYTFKKDLWMCYKAYHDEGDKETFDKALEWLVKEELIVVDNKDRVFSAKAFQWEFCIAKCIEMLYEVTLFDNMLKFGQDQEPVDWAAMKSQKGFPLCSEQISALAHHLAYPVIMVSGRGGSGKSDFLGCIKNLYSHNKVLCTAFQGTNAGALGKVFPGRSFTTHMLLHQHARHCLNKHNPFHALANKIAETYKTNVTKGGNEFEADTEINNVVNLSLPPSKMLKKSPLGIKYQACIFEDVEVFVVEEGSNQFAQIMCDILVALSCCGKLKKIIILGDRNQNPSIHAGDVMKQMYIGLKHLGCVVEFHHCHRINEGAEILKHNQDCILRKMPQSIVFDGKNCIHVPFKVPFKADFKLETANLKKLIWDVLETHNVGEYEMYVISRTRKYKQMLQFIVEEYYHNKQHRGIPYKKNCYWEGRRVTFAQNNYELGLLTNEVLMLKAITDDHTDARGKRAASRQLNTASRAPNCKQRFFTFAPISDLSANRNVPEDDWVKNKIKRASAATCHQVQGDQKRVIICVQPYFCKYDTNENMYTNWSRAEDVMIYVGTREALTKSIYNPEPARRSVLGEFIRDLCDKYKESIEPPDLTFANEKAKQEEAEEQNKKRKSEED